LVWAQRVFGKDGQRDPLLMILRHEQKVANTIIRIRPQTRISRQLD